MGNKVIFILLLSFIGCYAKNCNGTNDSALFAKRNQLFSANVFQLLSKSQNGNLIVSPLSAQIILALTGEGAKGATQSEISNGLKLLPNAEENRKSIAAIVKNFNQSSDVLKLLSANKLYAALDFDIEDEFRKIAVEVYRSEVQKVDFSQAAQTANTINSWVEDHTNNRIKNLIDANQLGDGIRLVLVNALYFSGKWVKPFEHTLTKKSLFHVSNSEHKEVDMMNGNINTKYAYNGKLKAKFLRMAFRESTVAMTFILPDAIDGLRGIEEKLVDYLEPQDFQDAYVAVSLPTFSVETKIDFIPILKQLGIKKLFDSSQADLSGISTKEGLFVSFVVQKAFINVTESGAEAAAATAVGVSVTAVIHPTNHPIFNADHPFLFYIKENQSSVILFIGRFET